MPERFGAAVTRALSKTVRLDRAENTAEIQARDNQRRDQPQVTDSDKSLRAAKRRSLKSGRSS